MKRCPSCRRVLPDNAMVVCPYDDTPLLDTMISPDAYANTIGIEDKNDPTCPPSLTSPLAESSLLQAKLEPNLICLQSDVVKAHMNEQGEIIEGADSSYVRRGRNFHAIIARYGNQPTEERKVGEIGNVSAQLTCMSTRKGRPNLFLNRGVWLSENDSRVVFGVKDTHSLVLAIMRGEETITLSVVESYFSGSRKGWITREKHLAATELTIKVQLISELDGAMLRETEFRIQPIPGLKNHFYTEFKTEHFS